MTKWPNIGDPGKSISIRPTIRELNYEMITVGTLKVVLLLHGGSSGGIPVENSMAMVLIQKENAMPSIWRKFLQYKNFPIPRSGFSKNYLTLKITPTPETKLAVTKQFFRAIKTVSLPIVLELIATSKTIFYQLSSAPQDQELLTRQLKTFFPEFIIEPVTVNRNQLYSEQPVLPAPETSAETTSQSLVLQADTELDYLFTLNLYPASTWNLFSTAKEFSVDPYHQLFNILDGVGIRDIIVIQFVIMPISEQGMRGMMGEIAGIAGDPSAYNQWEEAINEKEYDNFNEGIYGYTKPGKVELITTRSENEVFDFSKEIEEAEGDIRYYKTRKRQASRDGDRDLADAYQEDLEEARKRLRQYPEPTVINNYHYGTFKTLMPGVEKSVNEYLEGLSSKTPASLLGIKLLSSKESFIEQLKTDFFNSFANTKQSWAIASNTITATTSPNISEWGLVHVDELVTVAHFPTSQPDSDKVELTLMKSNKPPDLYLSNGIIIGQTKIRSELKNIYFPDNLRQRHCAIFGRSGTGKSTLIANCFRQDAEAGKAIAVVDPHGDLAQEVLDFIPSHRVNDVIYINPSDLDYPIGFDLMNAKTDLEIGNYAEDLILTIRRFTDVGLGNRMEHVLRFIFHTLLRIKGSTFMDVEKMLINEGFRKKMLANITSQRVLDFWQHEYAQESKDTIAALLTRFSPLSLNLTLSNLLSQKDSKFNFYDSIESKKIVIFDFAQGKIGQKASQLLASMVVSQYQLSIMRRVDTPKQDRHLLALYIDEFQTVTNPAFGQVMNEARKFGLGVTIATQFPSLIPDAIKKPILGNTGTFVFMQLESTDAQALRYELGNFTPEDVANLDAVKYEAICRPATKASDAFIMQTPAPPQPTNFRKAVIEQSRVNYGVNLTGKLSPLATQEAAQAPPVEADQAVTPYTLKIKQPAPALEKQFANAKDKILYYIEQADYLSNLQIAELCYGHHKTLASKKSAASRDLNQLVDSKKLKSQPFDKSVVYFTSRLCNPTTHNLLVRDLFVKIINSGFEISETFFAPNLKNFIPDLQINFMANDGDKIKTFWEFDAGTEGAGILNNKLKIYEDYKNDSLIVFVFDSEKRLLELEKSLSADFLVVSFLSNFSIIQDPGFRRLKEQPQSWQPIFSLINP